MRYFKLTNLANFILVFSLIFTFHHFSSADIFVPTQLQIDSLISEGDQFAKNGEFLRAWNRYKTLLTYNDIGRIVTETKPGYYIMAKKIILKKMAEILERQDMPPEIRLEMEVFFSNFNFSHFLDGNEETRNALIEKVRPYLSSQEGFKFFDDAGSIYFENGNCEKAVSLWEEAKDISLGYKSLGRKEKMTFSAKLGFCYRQLGWHDQLRALFEENPQLTQLEGKEVVDGFERISELLRSLNRYSETCPSVSVSQSDRETVERLYFHNELCLSGKVHWCFGKENHSFLSSPLILNNAVYIVAVNQSEDLMLFTLNKETGELLTEQIIASKNGLPWLSPVYPTLPYKLFLKNGRVQLTTEAGHHEFNLDGTINLTIDLTSNAVSEGTKYFYYTGALNPDYKSKLFSFDLYGKASTDPNAARALVIYGEAAVPYLIKELSNADSKVRIRAVTFLGKFEGGLANQAIPHLIRSALLDPDPTVRSEAEMSVEYIGKIPKKVLPDLITELANVDPNIRRRAAILIGNMGSTAREALPQLTQALSDSDLNVRREAQSAIDRIQSEPKTP